MLKGAGRAPVTCGELVQGVIGGQDFLVTCPLDLYSRATVFVEPEGGPGGLPVFSGAGEAGTFAGETCHRPEEFVEVLSGQSPDEVSKAVRAVLKTLAFFGVRARRIWLELDCPVPAGKGMGSSTADIVAAARAAAGCLGRELTHRQLAGLALSIEPSDGVMYRGVALFDHRRGRLARVLGAPPPARVLIFDYGGKVDTLTFNRNPALEELNRAKEKEVGEAFRKVRRGLRAGNLDLIGAGATQSALAHQAVLPKEGLEEITAAVRKMGAAGVVCAHSGTVIGVLYPEESARIKEGERFLSSLKCGEILDVVRLGGVRA